MMDIAYLINMELYEDGYFDQFYPEVVEPELYCKLLSN